MDIVEAKKFVAEHHRAVLATTGRPAGCSFHRWRPASTATGTSRSARGSRDEDDQRERTPYASLCVFTERFFGDWVQVEGDIEVVSLPEAMEGLVDYYRRISGEHPDWDDYRARWSTTAGCS